MTYLPLIFLGNSAIPLLTDTGEMTFSEILVSNQNSSS